jgi:hypothetical protein
VELTVLGRLERARIDRQEPSEKDHAATGSGPSFPNCLPVPGLLAGSSVVSRNILVSGSAVATPADFLPLAKRDKWDPVELKVLQFMCDDATRDYEFRKSKWREGLKDHLADMPQAFYDTLTTVAECDEIINWYAKKDIQDTSGRLAVRRSTLFASEFKAFFSPTIGLDPPTLPTGYKPSVDKKYKAVSSTSDRPPWQKIDNPYSGGGKETGIQNVQISQQLAGQGLQQTNMWGTQHDAVCVSCLRWTNVNMMDTDHAQPLKLIKERLLRLADAMSADPTIFDGLHSAAVKAGNTPTPADSYFIVKGTGTDRTFRLNEEGLSAYSHNMGNLMKMCKACNQGAGKHFGSLAEWLTGNEFYGQSLADTFPSGPGTTRIVDQNTAGKTPSQVIYSHLTDTYGQAVESTYTAHQFNEFSHRKITSTARKQFEVKQTPPSTTRSEREAQLEERGRRNDAMVRSTKVLQEHFSRKDREEIRSGSPERDQTDLKEHFKVSEEKRSRKRKSEDTDYDGFVKLARSGAPTDVKSVGDAKKQAVVLQANEEGRRQFALDKQAGIADALAADLSQDQSLATIGREPGYVEGFTDTLTLRAAAAAAGHADGINNLPVTLPTAADPAATVCLIQDYVVGYNFGRAEAAGRMVG